MTKLSSEFFAGLSNQRSQIENFKNEVPYFTKALVLYEKYLLKSRPKRHVKVIAGDLLDEDARLREMLWFIGRLKLFLEGKVIVDVISPFHFPEKLLNEFSKGLIHFSKDYSIKADTLRSLYGQDDINGLCAYWENFLDSLES